MMPDGRVFSLLVLQVLSGRGAGKTQQPIAKLLSNTEQDQHSVTGDCTAVLQEPMLGMSHIAELQLPPQRLICSL